VSPEVESLARIAGTLAAVLAAAAAVQWPLQRLRHRLPLLLTRHAMGGHATHPDPSFEHIAAVLLLPLTLGVWLIAGWIVTEQSSPCTGHAACLSGRSTWRS
jgi:hypothetical protein